MELNKLSPDRYEGCCHNCPEITATTYAPLLKMTPDHILVPNGDKLVIWSASIFFDDKDREYEAVFYPNTAFCVNCVGDLLDRYGNPMVKSSRVVQLSFCPENITPHNIREKFQTLKVWSWTLSALSVRKRW